MKILQFINSMHTAGAEVLVYETSRRFAKYGHEVDVFLLNTKKTKLYRDLEEIKGVNLIGIKEKNNIYNPLNIFRTYQILKDRGYDIVHVHLFPSFYWAAMASRAFGEAKLFYTEHNTTNRRMNNSLYRWVDNLVYPIYDCHIAISDTVRKKMEVHVDPVKNKIVTIYNGIDLNGINEAQPIPKDQLGVPPDSPIVLQVSAFRPQKDQETLIRAMKILDEKIYLLLAGDGELKEKYISLAKELGIQDRIKFLGIRSDIPRLLKTADIVVLSSHYEGLSLSSVEGLASGRPFIASDVPGLTEVVENAGILFPEGDENILASEISRLLNDKTLYQKVASASKKRSKKYDIEIMVDNYLSLYENSLKTHLKGQSRL
jgi:glycosyltransferase involved in cell wall biosynthesis